MYQTLLKPIFLDVKNLLLDVFFPITCCVCNLEGQFVCQDCLKKLAVLEKQKCILCQKPAPFGLTHPDCKMTFGAEQAISFFDYHDKNVDTILINGKYKFLPEIYRILGKIISEKIKINYPELLNNFLLVPLPLHKFRHRWRGFNQAEILCQELSNNLNLKILDCLKRSRQTKTQKNLKKEARLKNVVGAFDFKKNLNIYGHKIILVDDVTTTGATLLEAAKVLKKNGAAQVVCLTVAKD